MDKPTDSREIIVEESELNPNRYAVRAFAAFLVGILLACVFNELGVFEVSSYITWGCFLLCLLLYGVAFYLSRSETYVRDPRTKYVIIFNALLLTLAVTTLLNINVTLLYLFPMLLATQYRSIKVSLTAIIGSGVCCMVSPLLAWVAKSWSLNILTGYLETACDVSIVEMEPVVRPTGEVVFKMLVYLGLPQLMAIVVFGSIFLAITQTSIRGMKNRVRVLNLSEKLNKELDNVVAMQDQILYGISDIVENRDTATGGHVKRTQGMVDILLAAMREDPAYDLSDAFCSAVSKAAPLHDLGKIAVDDAILRKPGKLTEEESAVIRQHPVKSAEIIRKVLGGLEDEEFIRIAVNLALYHHEWYNGAGYPEGLKGEEISLEARVMAIADVYDALVSKRSYKDAMSFDRAFEIVESLMGTQFDPSLEKYFVAARADIERFYAE